MDSESDEDSEGEFDKSAELDDIITEGIENKDDKNAVETTKEEINKDTAKGTNETVSTESVLVDLEVNTRVAEVEELESTETNFALLDDEVKQPDTAEAVVKKVVRIKPKTKSIEKRTLVQRLTVTEKVDKDGTEMDEEKDDTVDVMDGSPIKERQHKLDDDNDKPRKGESVNEGAARTTLDGERKKELEERKESNGKKGKARDRGGKDECVDAEAMENDAV